MRRQINRMTLLTLSLAMGLAGCAKQEDKLLTQETKTETNEAAAKARASRAGKDYYDYINHQLLDRTEIPADSSSWSYFYELSEQSYEDLNRILQEAVEKRSEHQPGSLHQKIADLYLSAMDQSGRDQAGMGGLQAYLDSIRSASTVKEYVQALGDLWKDTGYGSLFSFVGEADMSDSSRYVYYLNGPDLGLGKETLEDPGQEALRDAYRNYIKKMLGHAGYSQDEAAESARGILEFQIRLADVSLPLSESGDPSKIYHEYSKEEVRDLLGNTEQNCVLDAFGLGEQERIIVTEPEVYTVINDFLTGEHLALLKDYSLFCLLNDAAPYLTSAVRNDYLEFRQYKEGTREIKTDEKLAGEMTQNLLGFEFGKLYVEKYFSEEEKQEVDQMARDILKTYEKRIGEVEWLGKDTREAAKRKLKTMVLKIGYPDTWPDYYESVAIVSPEEGGTLIDNVLALLSGYQSYYRSLMDGPVDRSLWQMTPQTVNAYYNPLANEIVFPAGILRSPFYDPDASNAENLGGIGMVIAHEITHAFDNNGAQYDEHGNYHVWWSDEDYRNFGQRTKAVVDYYNGFEGFGGIYVNGEQTLGENIADLGAVSCVMDLVGENPEDLKKLCQRYAVIWASKYTDESMKLRLNTDVHSPAKVRVNAVLSSTDGFYTAYPEIKEGDRMYVKPEKRVKVW